MNNKIWLFLSILTALLLFALYSIPNTVSYTAPTPEPITPSTATLRPELTRICSCESAGSVNKAPKQFNEDGSVVKGKINPQDTGMCQINLYYHEAQATKMGYDLFTKYGNIMYANWLYEQEGSTPWNWSKACWQ